MTKANCVRPGIMSLIRVKNNGNIIGESWLDLIHNRGYVEVDVTTKPEPVPEPIWLDITRGLTCTGDFENGGVISKTEDDYNIEVTMGVGENGELSLTPVVTKNGSSVGTASVWIVFKNEDEEVEKYNINDILTTVTSANEFDFQTDPRTYKGFLGYASIETDAELEENVFLFQNITYNDEEFDGDAEVYVKVVPSV